MAVENLEIVRQFLAEVNEKNLAGALGRVAPDAVLDWSDSQAPDGGLFHGRDAWGKWMEGRWESLVDATFDTSELVDVPPDAVVLVAYMRGRGRASGLQTEALGAGVFTLRDGSIARLRLYQTRAEAFKAVGLAT
ncbi:MAG TPA: nuclear transport factor 2 family protein [Solirubrobacteraceae bacterium]|jgi:ketosteroid isomerase-like protein|nr:nuclear transport factor 2 family protein [Solirubrobacteraceae bacterium]